jgi:hypothetical protein
VRYRPWNRPSVSLEVLGWLGPCEEANACLSSLSWDGDYQWSCERRPSGASLYVMRRVLNSCLAYWLSHHACHWDWSMPKF